MTIIRTNKSTMELIFFAPNPSVPQPKPNILTMTCPCFVDFDVFFVTHFGFHGSELTSDHCLNVKNNYFMPAALQSMPPLLATLATTSPSLLALPFAPLALPATSAEVMYLKRVSDTVRLELSDCLERLRRPKQPASRQSLGGAVSRPL